MQGNDTACRSGAPENHATLPTGNTLATLPKSSTNRVHKHWNVLKTPIVVLGTLSAFGALVYFVPMVAMALTCSAGLFLANTFVDGQFNRRTDQ